MPDGGRPPQSDVRSVLVAIHQALTVIGMAASGFFSPKAADPLTTGFRRLRRENLAPNTMRRANVYLCPNNAPMP